MVKRAPARPRKAKPGTKGLIPAECRLDRPTEAGTEAIAAIEKAGGCVVGSYREPLGGHPVLFSKTVYAELEKAPIDVGARAVVWAHAKEIHEHPTTEEGCVLNLNDPETLERVLRSME